MSTYFEPQSPYQEKRIDPSEGGMITIWLQHCLCETGLNVYKSDPASVNIYRLDFCYKKTYRLFGESAVSETKRGAVVSKLYVLKLKGF